MALDGVLQLDATADALVIEEEAVVTTPDNSDHSFSGIMFSVDASSNLPLHHLEINAIAVRGELGPVTVWVINSSAGPLGRREKRGDKALWTQLHKSVQSPSSNALVSLELSPPIVLMPGESRDVYVHSGLQGDTGIVYDNQRGPVTFEDRCIRILPGAAHLSSTPFSMEAPFWGTPWREGRSFVGRVGYSALWNKWSPAKHLSFPEPFQGAALAMLMGSRRQESLLYLLQVHICRYRDRYIDI